MLTIFLFDGEYLKLSSLFILVLELFVTLRHYFNYNIGILSELELHLKM